MKDNHSYIVNATQSLKVRLEGDLNLITRSPVTVYTTYTTAKRKPKKYGLS